MKLVPGFKLKDFKDRRDNLVQQILNADQKSNHVIIIPSSCTQYMTEKIPYIFRQNSDFRYLTGCLEPDSVLLMLISHGKLCESTLFVRPKSVHSELWEGPRTGWLLIQHRMCLKFLWLFDLMFFFPPGVDNAPQLFGVDGAKPNSKLLEELYVLKKGLDKFILWYDYATPVNSYVQQTIAKFVTETKFEVVIVEIGGI